MTTRQIDHLRPRKERSYDHGVSAGNDAHDEQLRFRLPEARQGRRKASGGIGTDIDTMPTAESLARILRCSGTQSF